MTRSSQHLILEALRIYKRENLNKASLFSALAKEAPDQAHAWSGQTHSEKFAEHMRIDEAVELAMQEIVVAQ